MGGGDPSAGGVAGGGVAGGGVVGGGVAGGGGAAGGGVATGGGTAADAGVLPRIDTIVPADVTVGEQIVVLGEGLADVQAIRFDSTPVPVQRIKQGSTDRLLLVNTPAIIGLPATGKVVVLSVTTSKGTAQGTFTLRPGVSTSLGTAVLLTPRSVTPAGSIQPGTLVTVTVDVQIAASQAETFDVSAAVEGAGFSIVDVVPGAIAVPESSAVSPVVTPVNVTVRTGTVGRGELGLKVRPRNFRQDDGSILIPRVALEVGAAPVVTDGVLFGDLAVRGPNALDSSNFVPLVRVFPGQTVFDFVLQVGSPVDGGTLAVSNLLAPAGWAPTTSVPVLGAAGTFSRLNVLLRAADGGTPPQSGELSFTVEDTSTGKARPFRGQVQLVR